MTAASTRASLREQLFELLEQDPAAVKAREPRRFDELAPPGAPLVLFGAGGLGRKTLTALARAGIRPVAIADNSARLHGSRIDGVEVLAPAEAARRYGEQGVFVVTVYVGAAAVRRQLVGLGCRCVLPFQLLAWKHPADLLPHYALDLPHKVIEERERILAAGALLQDEESRVEFLAQVRWRLDPSYEDFPPKARHEIYFPEELASLSADEFFVDCGGFDGDTVRSFVARTGDRFRKILVFEPDPANFARLVAMVKGLPPEIGSKVRAEPLALGARPGQLRLDVRGAASCVSETGELVVQVARLDAVLGDERPTWIKMDVEGAELEVLGGAEEPIRRHRPLLAISAYHRPDDPWRLPLYLRELNPGYRFHLRRYTPEINDDLVLYAVPEGRSPGPRPMEGA
jgi:FkbM family methyltransferase